MSSNLLKKRNEVFEGMKAIMNLATEKRSESDYKKYDELEAEYNKLGAEIEREVRFQTLEKSLNEVAEKRAITTGTNSTDANLRSAFVHFVRTGDVSELRAVNSYSSNEGGALIPTYMVNTIVENLQKQVVVRQLPGIVNYPTTSTTDIPLMPTDAQAAWGGETPSSSYSESNPAFGKATLKAYKLAALAKVSEETLQDTPAALEVALANSFTRQFAEAEDAAFLTNTTAGRPTGIFATDGIASTTVTASFTGSSVTDALIDLENSIAPQYRAGAVFVLSAAVCAAARKAKDNNGQYLWQPSLSADKPDTFGGRKVFIAGALPLTLTKTTHGGIVHPGFVYIGDRQGMAIQRLNELYAAEGAIGFRASKRTDIAVTNVGAVGKLVLN